MTNLLKFPNVRRTREVATTWIARVDRKLSEQELRELQHWLSQSPRHRRAFVEAAQLWDQMDVLAKLAKLFPLESLNPPPSRIPWKSLTAVASVAAVTMAFLLLPQTGLLRSPGRPQAVAVAPATPTPAALTYMTAVGQQTTVPLSDGTRIHLNTDSLVEVSYSANSRRIHLVRGEALFEVAKDPSRPFDVHAGSHVVRAVGTAFNVRVSPSAGMEVTVTEGRIRVLEDRALRAGTALPAGSSGMESPTAVAGQLVTVAGDGEPRVKALAADELSDRTAWEKGVLVFRGAPLRDVLKEFARYTDRKFVPNDDSIGDIPVGGFYRATDVDSLLLALNENFELRTWIVGDTVIIARRTDAAGRR